MLKKLLVCIVCIFLFVAVVCTCTNAETCDQIVENCVVCKDDYLTCVECAKGYFLEPVDNACYSCPVKNCEDCEEHIMKCDKCFKTYKYNNITNTCDGAEGGFTT